MEARRRPLAVLAAAAVLVAGGCTAPARSPISGRIASPVSWRRVALPPDPRGAALVRAVGHCAAGWYAAGAIVSPGGDNHPALWFSSDGTSFTPVTIKPISVYGPQNILYSVACNGAEVVAVGAAIGGAHGNPRTSTWYGGAGGTLLTEAPAAFETYGGPDAVGVGPVAAGSAGFLIVGGRVDANNAVGAAVWSSRYGHQFELIDSDSALESGTHGATEVHGGYVADTGSPRWLAVGGLTPAGNPGAPRDPAVWTSPDGIVWQLDELPSTGGDDILEQATPTSTGLLAVGIDGAGFSAWTSSGVGAAWRKSAHFGDHAAATAAPRTVGIAALASQVYAAIYDGRSYHLWRGASAGTSWRTVASPPGTATITGIAGASGTALVSVTAGHGASELFLTTG